MIFSSVQKGKRCLACMSQQLKTEGSLNRACTKKQPESRLPSLPYICLPLGTLPMPVQFSNALIFPLHPRDQVHLGLNGFPLLHLPLPYMTISPLLSLKVKDNLKRVVKEDQSFKKKTWHGLRMVNEVPILVPFLNAEDPVLANSSH